MVTSDATDTIVLGPEPIRGTAATVRSFQGGVSTGSFRPASAELSDRNPPPAVGHVEAAESLAAQDAEAGSRAVPSKDGRYRLGEASPESVTGTDDRVRVADTTAWPYRVHGYLEMRFPDGSWYIGSGTMVNHHHVLTAAHYLHFRRVGWVATVQFYPARDEWVLPFGEVGAARLLAFEGWTRNEDLAWDIAMIILSRDVGHRTGWLGVASFDSDADLLAKTVNITGYPPEKGRNQMWTHGNAVTRVTSDHLFHTIDTTAGQCSGVWGSFAEIEGEKVVAVQTQGAPGMGLNSATRISRAKFDRIVQWMTDY